VNLQTDSPGVVIGGLGASQYLGNLVCSIDDVNGDGYSDMLVLGGATSSSASGTLYLILGSQYSANIDIDQLPASKGIKITGSYFYLSDAYTSYVACAPAGDINADGYNDFIIGASHGVYDGTESGVAYIIYGRPSFTTIDVDSLSTDGIIISSATEGAQLGYAVAAAGDVDNDGYADVIITACGSGYSYVYYGSSSPSSVLIVVEASVPTHVAVVVGTDPYFGYAAAGVGDMDNDGFDDIMITCPTCNNEAGYTYVIWGKALTKGGTLTMFSSTWEYPSVTTNSKGFVIVGAGKSVGTYAPSFSGCAVSSAGDFNGDGTPDLLIGAFEANLLTGAAYVIYGSSSMPARILLATLKPSRGFPIHGDRTGDFLGSSLASAGDFNSDGYDDIVVGAPYGNQVGAAYVIFGAVTHGAMSVGAMSYSVGFPCYGAQSNSQAGFSVSGGFDVNQDGYTDIVIGSPYSDPITGTDAGSAYIVYGQASVSHDIRLSTLTIVNTLFANVVSSTSVDIIGNVSKSAKKYLNMVVGVPSANDNRGQTYLYYGNTYAFRYLGNLSEAGSAVGTTITGASIGDQSGHSVSSAGDIDNDGWDDIVIGAPGTSSGTGTAYVLYGGQGLHSHIDLALLTSSQGFSVTGPEELARCGYSVSNAGDVNGDGYDDVVIGCPSFNSAYVIYGGSRATLSSIYLVSGLTGSRGFIIGGGTSFSNTGCSVGDAGDFNGDGYSDIVIGSTGKQS
jgi:hypothetical protein